MCYHERDDFDFATHTVIPIRKCDSSPMIPSSRGGGCKYNREYVQHLSINVEKYLR